MKKEKIFNYIIAVSSIAVVALLGGIFTNKGMNWYDDLYKPSQWIPSIVIPIIWGAIYSLIAIFLICKIKKEELITSSLVWLLVLNGIVNVLWCYVFFTLNNLIGGQILIVLNIYLSVLLIKEIHKTNQIWSAILYIYPLWLSIATSLNIATWILN